MGCCEGRNASDHNLNLQFKTYFNPLAPTGYTVTNIEEGKKVSNSETGNFKFSKSKKVNFLNKSRNIRPI
jgi:hypothetical protein